MSQPESHMRDSERARVARDEKLKAMDELREQAREHGTDDGRDQRGGTGDWPGKDLTRNTLPHAEPREGEANLPDDVRRDISRDGVVDEPSKRVELAP